MPKLRPATGNPDRRPRRHTPAPEIEHVLTRLREVLTPATFAAAREAHDPHRFRDRLLTLPAMTALVVALVYRQIPSLSELTRVLALEGVLWLEPMPITRQALSKRLQTLPATLFARLFAAVVVEQQAEPSTGPELPPWQQRLRARFGAVWIADGSTLEALRGRPRPEGSTSSTATLGGKMMMLVEAFSARPIEALYEPDAALNDKHFTDAVRTRLPEHGLLVFDMGFFSFPFFDAFTDSRRYFLTRLREKTAYRTVRVLAEGPCYRDEVIEMGLWRSHPCEHPVRLVSVLWGTVWYRYITNVLDPADLSAQEVAALYRHRWRIEESFATTTRLLGLSYLWVGGTNGVEVQIYATWIFYAVLMDVSAEVASSLGEPVERVSVEMVFRGLYHYSRAEARGKADDVVAFLVAHARLLGIVKAYRKHHRKRDDEEIEIWGALLS